MVSLEDLFSDYSGDVAARAGTSGSVASVPVAVTSASRDDAASEFEFATQGVHLSREASFAAPASPSEDRDAAAPAPQADRSEDAVASGAPVQPGPSAGSSGPASPARLAELTAMLQHVSRTELLLYLQTLPNTDGS